MKRRRIELSSQSEQEAISKDEITFLTSLLIAVLHDISLALNLDLTRDVTTILARVKSEGFAFLTKTLPQFAAFVLLGLETGQLDHTPGFPFGRANKRTVLPSFLKAVLSRLFDRDGVLLQSADADEVRAVEQICNMLKKYEAPMSDEAREEAFERVLSLDSTLPDRISDLTSRANFDAEKVLYVASIYLEEVLGSFDGEKITPKHGPGSTALGNIDPWEKYYPRGMGKDCLDIFGNLCLMQATPSVVGTAICKFDPHMAVFQSHFTDVTAPHRSKMAAVNKDSSGPRVIQQEMPEYMYLQQGIWLWMKEVIEKHPNTAGHVNFTHQEVNQALALASSKDQKFCTLDLKDASNRNSLALVYNLMPEPLLSALLATRSTHVFIYSEDECTKLGMFAPMGSAVCFPVQSMVYWSLCVGRMVVDGYSPEFAMKNVYVYGDDIIVPTWFASRTIETLEAMGLVVNVKKSFIQGFYRESCGVNAFKGEVTTPLRIKKRWFDFVRTDQQTLPDGDMTARLVAWVEYSNNFHMAGYWTAAALIQAHIESNLEFKLPVVPEKSGVLGWISFTGRYDPNDRKWRPSSKRVKVKYSGNGFKAIEYKPFYFGLSRKVLCAYSPVVKPPLSEFSDEKAYLRYFIGKEGSTLPDCRRGNSPKDSRASGSRTFTLRNTLVLKWIEYNLT